MHTIVILRTLHESLALCTSYAAACESGDDKDAKVEWNQKDTVLPIGLALTEFHCILLFRDKWARWLQCIDSYHCFVAIVNFNIKTWIILCMGVFVSIILAIILLVCCT